MGTKELKSAGAEEPLTAGTAGGGRIDSAVTMRLDTQPDTAAGAGGGGLFPENRTADFSPQPRLSFGQSLRQRLGTLIKQLLSIAPSNRRNIAQELSTSGIHSKFLGGYTERAELCLDTENTSSSLPDHSEVFESQRKIDSGGYCDILRAHDRKLNREVAIKTLRTDRATVSSTRNSFLIEANIMAYLDHPSIVPVYDLYSSNNKLHLVMKLLRGINLKDLLGKTLALYDISPKNDIVVSERRLLFERLDIFLKVCDAVGYAHHKGVIHRDLKPENIMIGEFNNVYVMDWGIAEHQSVDTVQRIAGRVAGTIQYIAPELITKRPYDSRSDIFSLGLILYEIVFLKTAYKDGSNTELRKAVIEHQIEPYTHEFGLHVDRDLKLIIDKAIMPYPEARYQNVKALAEDIKRYIRLEPVNAEFNGFAGWLGRLRRRFR